jgi:hypothetical protein
MASCGAQSEYGRIQAQCIYGLNPVLSGLDERKNIAMQSQISDQGFYISLNRYCRRYALYVIVKPSILKVAINFIILLDSRYSMHVGRRQENLLSVQAFTARKFDTCGITIR